MARTRAAVLDGAAQAVEKYGARKTTMADIASLSGVAKATVYNHFRTKEDLFRAAVEAGIRDAGLACAAIAATDLTRALATAAERVGSVPALRRIALEEPALLAHFAVASDSAPWRAARQAADAVLAAAGRRPDPASADLLVRWVASHVGTPAVDGHVEYEAWLLATALTADTASVAGASYGQVSVAGE
jgi:AcrR family transcriptional regulator